MPSDPSSSENTSPINFEENIKGKVLYTTVLIYLLYNAFFLVYNGLYTNQYNNSILQAVFFILSLGLLIPVTKKKYGLSKFLIFLFLNLQIFLTSMYVLPGRGAEYFYLLIIVLFIILGNNPLQLYLLITLDIFLFLAPQFFVHPYPIENYSYVNIIALTIAIVISLRYFIIIQDRYKELLKTQRLKLEKLNVEKNDLMSIVAHDLKTPLAQIEGLISILELESDKLSNEQKELMRKIKGLADNHKNQITGYLKNQSIEESIEKAGLSDVNLNKTILQVINEMAPLAKAKSIEVKHICDSKNILIHGIEEGLYKVFSNLLSNAIKYSEPNKKVVIDVKSDQKQVLVTVQDRGPGFKENDLENVFKKHQVLSAVPTNNEPSSGIGLYIVKRYIDRMSGWIWLESKEGEGSTFYIKLPRA